LPAPTPRGRNGCGAAGNRGRAREFVNNVGSKYYGKENNAAELRSPEFG